MEKLSLDTDSPIRGDYKRDTDTHTPVRQIEREREPGIGGGVLGMHDTKIISLITGNLYHQLSANNGIISDK